MSLSTLHAAANNSLVAFFKLEDVFTVLATTTTDDNGFYQFTDLTPGEEYQVQFVAPDGLEASPQDVGDDATDSDADETTGLSQIVVLASGENNPTIDAGYYETASLGDFVFTDENANGQQDPEDEGIEDVTVNLLVDGAVVATTTTDENGFYEFTDLTPGEEYVVEFVAPDGFETTPSDQGDDATDSDADETTGQSDVVVLTSGENNPTIDAGYYETASLGDFVFLDEDADGIQDPGEEGVEGVTVNLKDEDGNVIATTETDENGAYLFDGLVPGEYSVQFVLPAGNEFSPLNEGGDEALDSDADVAMDGMTEPVVLTSGEDNEDLDAGIYEPASLGDFVFLDEDGDGIQDPEDDGIEDVTVNLLDEDGNVIATTTTDENGFYEFTDLTPDTYSVEFVTPDGLTASPANQGSDDAMDSDAVGGETQQVTLVSGENNPTLDAGFYETASLGDFVFLDDNANGQQDAEDEGIEDVRVNLLVGTTVVATTTTDENGFYQFTDLTPGEEYVVEFEAPAGFETTPSDQGDDTTDSDADETTGQSDVVVLTSGENNPTIDAGYYETASLGDFVFLDEDADGIQDPGEEGVEGVTVNLKDEDGNVIATTETDENGAYLFDGLVPGEYSVQFVLPDGSEFSPLNASGDEAAKFGRFGSAATSSVSFKPNHLPSGAAICSTDDVGINRPPPESCS